MLSKAEIEHLLVLGNGGASDYPRDKTVHQVFEDCASRHPDKTAVICGSDELSYQELDRRANQLASVLRERNITRGDCVACCIPRSLDTVAVLLGILKAGGAYMPLPPEYPRQRLQLMLENAEASVLVTTRDLADQFSGTVETLVFIDDLPECHASCLANLGEGRGGAEEAAYVMYTSGTTGVPKGVVVPHRAINRLVLGADYLDITSDDRFLQYAPLAFDASTLEIWGPLLNSATLVMAPPGVLTLRELSDAICEHRITTLWLTAGLFHEMVDHNLQAFEGLQNLLAGGDVLSVEAVRKVKQRFPSLRLINGYGPTENTTFSCCYTVDDPAASSKSVPIGRPICNSEAHVLDESLQLAPLGEEGELYVGGDGLAVGYFGDSKLTQERFVDVALSGATKKRLYRTGDRVRWNARGELEFLGRVDSQIKLRGYRIEAGEVESVLQRHPEIRDVAVGVREFPTAGKRLVACVVPKTGGQLETALIRKFAVEHLPNHMVPADFEFLDRLPLTSNGKVDRKQLFRSKAPGRSGQLETVFSNCTEAQIAKLWRDVLGIESPDVNVSFLALGGDSLRAIQLAAKLESELQVVVPITAEFLAGTVQTQARMIEAEQARHQSEQRPKIEPVARNGESRLSFPQSRLWFLHQLDSECRAYNIVFAYRLKGSLSREELARAVRHITDRHEILRTRFHSESGTPFQRVDESIDSTLSYYDLRQNGEEDERAVLDAWVADVVGAPVDLESGPLFRLAFWRTTENCHVMGLAVHHMVFDGGSESVFFRELGCLLDGQQESDLPVLSHTYADYANWQQGLSSTARFKIDREYWINQLRGAPPMLDLPTDRSRPSRQTWVGRTLFRQVPSELVDEIEQVCQSHRVTIFVMLLAAFQVFLNRCTGQDDLVVGTAVAQRKQPEIEPLIGLFASTVALRTDLSGNPSFSELLKRVTAVLYEGLEHQDYPFEQIVRDLQIDRQLVYSPLMQVAFVMHDSSIELPSIRVERVPVDTGTSKFDLTLYVVKDHTGLQLWMEYNTDLFDQHTAQHWLDSIEALLKGIVQDPNLPIDDFACNCHRSHRENHSPPSRSNIHALPGARSRRVELALSPIWRDLTGIEGISAEDNFFSVGGHSLMAVQLAARIEDVLGAKLSVSQIFQYPTIAQQAQLISVGEDTQRGDCLISYRVGVGDPLILLPNIAGQAYGGRWLLKHLPETTGIVAVDLDPVRESVKSMTLEQLATRCVEAIQRDLTPESYKLLGYSFGGMLAYEVARQLEASGARVSFVGIIDTGPANPQRPSRWGLTKLVGPFTINASRWLFFHLKYRRLTSLLKRAQSYMGSSLQRLRGTNGRSRHEEDENDENQVFPSWIHTGDDITSHTKRVHYRAILSYVPGGYQGQVTLFRARVRTLLHHFTADAGWAGVAVGRLDIRVVPGNHFTMLDEPNCTKLAQELRGALDEIVEEGPCIATRPLGLNHLEC